MWYAIWWSSCIQQDNQITDILQENNVLRGSHFSYLHGIIVYHIYQHHIWHHMWYKYNPTSQFCSVSQHLLTALGRFQREHLTAMKQNQYEIICLPELLEYFFKIYFFFSLPLTVYQFICLLCIFPSLSPIISSNKSPNSTSTHFEHGKNKLKAIILALD